MQVVYKVSAQTDSVWFKKGDVLVGEIKGLEEGVLSLKTYYSDSDFKIDWKEVDKLITETHFIVTLKSSVKYFSTIRSINDSIAMVIANNHTKVTCNINDIVFLQAYEQRIIDRFDAEISIGLDMAQSRNLRKISTRSFVSYSADKFSTDISYNTLLSRQDETDDIKRSEGEYNFRYIFPLKWYAIATVASLTNTEQLLKLRMNTQAGLGRFIFRNNAAQWGFKLGVNRNFENYIDQTEHRNTWEAYFGTEIKLFDLEDIDLIVNLIAYQGVTEKDRLRLDTHFDLKYDLPLDFFIKLGWSFNYDNQPISDASKTDYIIYSGFGWEW